jgi:large repetitive protein
MTGRTSRPTRRTRRLALFAGLIALVGATIVPHGAAAAGPSRLGLNRPPVIVADVATTPEDTAVDIDVLMNDSDPNDDTLTVTALTTPAFGTATVNANGTVRYVANPDANGSDTFDYTVEDGAGGSGTGTVTVTVNPVDDLPTAADDILVTTLDTPSTIAVLANDYDADDDPLIVSLATTPAHGSAMVEADGTITYFPDPGYDGQDAFEYAISEGAGDIQTAEVSVMVTLVNHPPLGVPDRLEIREDTIGSVKPAANDTDEEGGALVVTAVTQPAHGSVALYADGTVAYAPEPNYNGPDAFEYTVADGAGADGVGIVSVTVSPADDRSGVLEGAS